MTVYKSDLYVKRLKQFCEKIKGHSDVPLYKSFLFSISMILLSLTGYFVAKASEFGYMLIMFSTVVMFCFNIYYSIKNRRKNFVILIFNIVFFVFLLARPVIDVFTGHKWYLFSRETDFFSMFVILIGLTGLRLGIELNECLDKRTKITFFTTNKFKNTKPKEEFIQNLRFVSLCFYVITMIVYCLIQGEKLLYMNGRSYEELYLFQSKLPFYIHTLGSMAKYVLCLFLSTKPSKKMAFIPLAVFVLSGVPLFLIGSRSQIVLNILFVLSYYLIRDALQDDCKWFGKTEKYIIAIGLPIGILLLGLMEYIRSDVNNTLNVIELAKDFLYKQGTSFTVLGRAYDAIPYLPDVIEKNYTFGSIIDYFKHGTISQKLFGAMSLGNGNSELIAVYGHSFAHSMSYVAHPEYLSGHGYGSSYLLETFVDWGYMGVFIFNVILGMFFSKIVDLTKKNILCCTIVLVSLTNLFFIPRADASSWIAFIFTIQFWLVILACYIGTQIFMWYTKRTLKN